SSALKALCTRRALFHGAQWLCGALIVSAGIHVASRIGSQADVALNAPAVNVPMAGVLHEGLPVDLALDAAHAGLSQVQVIVERNDTLDLIFRRLQLSMNDMASVLAIDDVRRSLTVLRPGDLLTLVHRGSELVGLERQISIDRTLKVARDANARFVANIEELPLERQLVTTSAQIDSSLFVAGTAAGLRDATILQLAEIFRWDVDFVLDLRQGDSFSVVYEKLLREGEYVGDGRIVAAEFINDGKRFRAVRFEGADGKADYYAPDGRGLRKSFLKAPVQFSRISSVFNPRRKHPVLNTIRAHKGVDYAAPSGTPVKAAGAGRVRFRGVNGGFGNLVEIEHSGGVVTRYGHLSRFASGLKAGMHVDQGQLIGYVGKTGLATGPHLHFEYLLRGVNLDPQVAIRRAEPAAPISESNRAAFEQQTWSLVARLDNAGANAEAMIAAR
ncbi:MAG: peptidoglycan DD-metalloendopeptidase family protein, partial [Nevskiaceae bacterium]|nr:peptidoglycan DD-metalloendopeptidase family protein [Nevskiaceae bacterium]